MIFNKAEYVVYIDIISNVHAPATGPDNLATLRIKRTIRRIADNSVKTDVWNIRLTYRYVPHRQLTDSQREVNPLGFIVTSYQRDKELRGMMLKHTLLLSGLLASCVAWSAATPRGSAYDSRMQNVTYNSQNATVVSTRPGYVTMLVFDDDETVIDAQAGFPRGWTVTKSDNRVGVSPNPIAQPVTDASGNNVSQLFLPTAKDWKTNLFVVTSKRDYSRS